MRIILFAIFSIILNGCRNQEKNSRVDNKELIDDDDDDDDDDDEDDDDDDDDTGELSRRSETKGKAYAIVDGAIGGSDANGASGTGGANGRRRRRGANAASGGANAASDNGGGDDRRRGGNGGANANGASGNGGNGGANAASGTDANGGDGGANGRRLGANAANGNGGANGGTGGNGGANAASGGANAPIDNGGANGTNANAAPSGNGRLRVANAGRTGRTDRPGITPELLQTTRAGFRHISPQQNTARQTEAQRLAQGIHAAFQARDPQQLARIEEIDARRRERFQQFNWNPFPQPEIVENSDPGQENTDTAIYWTRSRGPPVEFASVEMFYRRGLPIAIPRTDRGLEIAGLIATTADASLLERIGALMVDIPVYLNDPFTSSAVSLILVAGDNPEDPKYMAGMARLDSLRQVNAMRDLLEPEANVSDLELFEILMSNGGDFAAYFTNDGAARGSPPPNIMESLRNFRAHSVKRIVDQVMDAMVRQNRRVASTARANAANSANNAANVDGYEAAERAVAFAAEAAAHEADARAANETAERAASEPERERVSGNCARETETLPMYSLERPIRLMECLDRDVAGVNGVARPVEMQKIIFGPMVSPTAFQATIGQTNPDFRMRDMKRLIIENFVRWIMDILQPGLSPSGNRDAYELKTIEYKNKILMDPILVEKLINFAFDDKMITPIPPEPAVVRVYKDVHKYAIAMILPHDVMGEVDRVTS